MSLALPVAPVYVVDLAGSAMMIVLSFAAMRVAHRLMRRAPRELLWSYLLMLSSALAAFSVGRGIGHIVRDLLISLGHPHIWSRLSPISGAINTATFIFIAAVTLYYSFVEKAFLQIRQAHAKLGEALEEIRRNRDQVILLECHAIAGRMAATLAHETRNPLFVIANSAKSLLRKCEKENGIVSRLKVIVEESERLSGLVDGILKVKDDAPYLMRRVAANEVLAGVERNGRDKAEVARVRLRLTPLSAEAWFEADRESLLVGLNEIVINAVEASPKGGAVDIEAVREAERVVFRITDAGKGIPAEVLPRIFDPCFSTKEFSAGLGLSFAKEIIEANHGRLKVETAPGKGTTVTVVFPLAEAETAAKGTAPA